MRRDPRKLTPRPAVIRASAEGEVRMSTAGTLTVKHVEEGRETIRQATHVEYIEYPDDHQREPDGPMLIAYGVPDALDGTINRYGSGIVYVMNEAGATVGRYDLEMRPPRRKAA